MLVISSYVNNTFLCIYKSVGLHSTADLIVLYSSSGYMAPEYAMRGYLTDKADVYSFGVVALEVVSGKSNTNYRPKEDFVYLLDWVPLEPSSIHKEPFGPFWMGTCYVITLHPKQLWTLRQSLVL